MEISLTILNFLTSSYPMWIVHFLPNRNAQKRKGWNKLMTMSLLVSWFKLTLYFLLLTNTLRGPCHSLTVSM